MSNKVAKLFSLLDTIREAVAQTHISTKAATPTHTLSVSDKSWLYFHTIGDRSKLDFRQTKLESRTNDTSPTSHDSKGVDVFSTKALVLMRTHVIRSLRGSGAPSTCQENSSSKSPSIAEQKEIWNTEQTKLILGKQFDIEQQLQVATEYHVSTTCI